MPEKTLYDLYTERLRDFVRATMTAEHAATDGSAGDEMRAGEALERAETALQDALLDVVSAEVEKALSEANRRYY